jgi:hypothetical protein
MTSKRTSFHRKSLIAVAVGGMSCAPVVSHDQSGLSRHELGLHHVGERIEGTLDLECSTSHGVSRLVSDCQCLQFASSEKWVVGVKNTTVPFTMYASGEVGSWVHEFSVLRADGTLKREQVLLETVGRPTVEPSYCEVTPRRDQAPAWSAEFTLTVPDNGLGAYASVLSNAYLGSETEEAQPSGGARHFVVKVFPLDDAPRLVVHGPDKGEVAIAVDLDVIAAGTLREKLSIRVIVRATDQGVASSDESIDASTSTSLDRRVRLSLASDAPRALSRNSDHEGWTIRIVRLP